MRALKKDGYVYDQHLLCQARIFIPHFVLYFGHSNIDIGIL